VTGLRIAFLADQPLQNPARGPMAILRALARQGYVPRPPCKLFKAWWLGGGLVAAFAGAFAGLGQGFSQVPERFQAALQPRLPPRPAP